MDKANLKFQAEINFCRLGTMKYPGSCIIVGVDETMTNLVQIIGIMGRQETSRNRKLALGEKGRLYTRLADPSKPSDPFLSYNVMVEMEAFDSMIGVVGNGSQTDEVAERFNKGETFYDAMRSWSYEPLEPNFTPRITAASWWDNQSAVRVMSNLRKSLESKACDRLTYEFNGFGSGFGRCITTFSGEGDPLPAFEGTPYLLPLHGDIQMIANNYWEVLNKDSRVALGVKFIPRHGASTTVIKP